MKPLLVPILPPEAQRRVQSELRPGERLIWAAQPLPRMMRVQSCLAMAFAVPFTAFSIFWVSAAGFGISHSRAPGIAMIFPMLGVPFVIVGIGLFCAPLWMGRLARNTVYAITEQRAIVFSGRLFGGANVQTFMPERLTSMTRKERADGSGDLIFEQFSQPTGSGSTIVRRGFLSIPNVRQAEDLIASTLLAGRIRKAEP